MVNNNSNSSYVHYPCEIERENEAFSQQDEQSANGFQKASAFASKPRRRSSIRRVSCKNEAKPREAHLTPDSCSERSHPLVDADACCMVIIGEFSVGKSSLCQNFYRDGNLHQSPTYHREFVTKKEENHHIYERPITFGADQSRRIRLLDVNTERHLQDFCVDNFASMTSYIGIGDAFIVVYATTNTGTFKTAQETLEHLEKLRRDSENKKFALVLVGNKCDLVRKRQVSIEEGVRLAEKFGAKFIETSALLGINATELFEGTFRQVLLRQSADVDSRRKKVCSEESFKEKRRSLFKRSFRLSRSRSLRSSRRSRLDPHMKSSNSFSLQDDEPEGKLPKARSQNYILKLLKNLTVGGKRSSLKNLTVGGKRGSLKNKTPSCQDFTKI